jgi:sugar-specific transcriptional regulator TrmB
MDKNILNELHNLGLSEKEARVYVASVQIGSAPMQKIAKLADVNRATTYVLVESLMKKGLMTSVTKGKKRYFQAEQPERLLEIIQKEKKVLLEREEVVQNLVPHLMSLHSASQDIQGKPKVKFYEGKNGLLAVRDEILKSKEKEAFSLYNRDSVATIFTPEERAAFSKKRIEKKVKSHALYTSKEGDTLVDNKAEYTNYSFIKYDEYNSPIDITVFDDKVAITSLEEPLMSVIIENKDIANSIRQLLSIVESKTIKTDV